MNPSKNTTTNTMTSTAVRQEALNASQSVQKAQKPAVDGRRGSYEVEIAKITGWDCLNSLSETGVAALCECQRINPQLAVAELMEIKAQWSESNAKV